MSNVKAIICSILLLIVIFVLLVATMFIESENGITLYSFVVGAMAGMWIGDKVGDFYIWLRSK